MFPDSDIETIFSNPDFEVTDEYDLPSGARIWKSTEFDGQESAGVYLPMGGGAVEVNTGLQSQNCLAALRPVHDHMLNSLEVV